MRQRKQSTIRALLLLFIVFLRPRRRSFQMLLISPRRVDDDDDAAHLHLEWQPEKRRIIKKEKERATRV